MTKIKAVTQRDLRDCGVCCMKWIILHFSGYISLEKLREDTLTDNTGTSAYHIVNAFQKYGFDSKGIFEENINCNKVYYPLIAHFKLENGLEHFVVVTKIYNNIVHLMDPGVGYTKMTIEQFNKLFTGHIILVYPRNKVVSFNKESSISELFFNIINKEKFLMIKIILTSIIWTIFLILSTYYLKVGSNMLNEDSGIFKYIILCFGIITILKILFMYIRDYYLNHLSNLVDVYIYPEFLKHLFFLPLKSVKSRTTGEIVTRIQELSSIKNLFSEIFVSCFLDSIMALLAIFALYIINRKLLVCLFIFILIYILFGIINSKIMYKKVLKNINYQTDFNSTVIEHIDMFESIKNLNISNKVLERIESVLSRLLLNNYEFNSFFNKTNLGKDIILEFCVFIVNTYGFILIRNNNLSLIDLFTFNVIISYFLDPIKNMINLLPKYNYIKGTFSKIQEFINISEEQLIEANESLGGNIEFKNVSYSYNNYDNVISDYNFKIHKGMHVLLNGPSGSGKSTICKLIYRENDLSKGEILIDDKNIKSFKLSTIRNNILYISQNEKLFTGSIKENILIYRDIDEDSFNKVCNICHINEIVETKGMQYDSLIDATSNLSGGERQRIILARGLLKNASVIILDEALSEVDKTLETKIVKAIQKYFKDKTIIYISHKDHVKNFEYVINIGELNGIL